MVGFETSGSDEVTHESSLADKEPHPGSIEVYMFLELFQHRYEVAVMANACLHVCCAAA